MQAVRGDNFADISAAWLIAQSKDLATAYGAIMSFSENDQGRADLRLLARGAVTLFWRQELFDATILELETLGYNIMQFKFETSEQFQNELSTALKWEDQFGYHPWTGNLDALNDGMYSEAAGQAKDNAICINDFDVAVRENAHWASEVLDVFAVHSRNYLLFGRRLICLVRTNDPKYECKPLGGRPPFWTDAEWSNRARGL
jgi:hypothetical protein